MNTLTVLTLATAFTANVYSTDVSANELAMQLRAEANQQISELLIMSRKSARQELLKAAITIQAQQSAEQFVTDLQLAKHAAKTNLAAE